MDSGQFRELARSAYMCGRETHGDLNLSGDAYANRLGSVFEKYKAPVSGEGASAFLQSLYTDDLYLTSACAAGTEPGWTRFRLLYKSYLNSLCAWVRRDSGFQKELADGLMTDLYLPDHSGQSRISSYDGRSSLATWLRVVVSNRAFNERKRKCNQDESVELTPEIADFRALNEIESYLGASRYAPVLADAISSACGSLSNEERMMMLWRYEQELQLGEIARLMRVHQSTVSRQLDRAMLKIRMQVTAVLKVRHGLSDAAVTECLQYVSGKLSQTTSVLSIIKAAPASEDKQHLAQIASLDSPAARKNRGATGGGACVLTQ